MNHLALSIISTLIIALSENLFFILNDKTSLVPMQNYIGLFLFYTILTLIPSKKVRLGFIILIPILSIFQMLHISFYGLPVYPSAIYLFFAESSEVFGTLREELALFIIPSLITGFSIIFLYLANRNFKPKLKFKFIPFLLIFYLLYNPMRTYFTGNTWGRQPSTQDFLGVNMYLSLSYFLGRILPYKMSHKTVKSSEEEFQFTKTSKFKGNIIFVIGESLSANHLSLLGYKRKTTPRLNLLKNDPNFYYSAAISSGVSTDVSIAFMINNTYGLKGQRTVFQGKQCLFNMALNNGFKTTFYSSQSQQQLRYITNSICLPSIENYKSLEDLEPNIKNSNAANDFKLLDSIEDDLYSIENREKNHFYVLHQRGSHGPYSLRYPENETVFSLTGKYQQDRVNHYDNSVIQFDKFFDKLIKVVKNHETPTLVIYISDHGEGLGEEGVWGHAALKKPSFSIPFLAYFHKIEDIPGFSTEPTHLEVTSYIAKMLGYTSNLTFPLENYVVLGNDLDGLAGYLILDFEKGKLKSYKRQDF